MDATRIVGDGRERKRRRSGRGSCGRLGGRRRGGFFFLIGGSCVEGGCNQRIGGGADLGQAPAQFADVQVDEFGHRSFSLGRREGLGDFGERTLAEDSFGMESGHGGSVLEKVILAHPPVELGSGDTETFGAIIAHRRKTTPARAVQTMEFGGGAAKFSVELWWFLAQLFTLPV